MSRLAIACGYNVQRFNPKKTARYGVAADVTKPPEPEKFDLRSHDTASDKIAELLRLFPEIRTEGGKLDFDRLKLALGESVHVGRERYGMELAGQS